MEEPTFDVGSFLAAPGRMAQVAAVSPAGRPLLGSLWFAYLDRRFWFTSDVSSPLVRAVRHSRVAAVIVDQFDPPEEINQVRVRGAAVLEPRDPDRVRMIYRRYLGARTESWPDFFVARASATGTALWSVRPESGIVASTPHFRGPQVRWTTEEQCPLP